jgi:WD40 repeat protein
VNGALLLPDAARALSWSSDGTLKLWDLHSGHCVQTLEGHANSVTGALLLPDASHALSWSNDKTLKLWDLHSGHCVQTLEGHANSVTGALLLPDASRALSWSSDHALKLWSLTDGRWVASWTLDAFPTALLLSTPSTLWAGDARGGVHFLEIREC